MWNQRKQLLPWQIIFAWIVGLLAVANIVVINIFPLEKVRFSSWIYVFPFVNTLSCAVTANAAMLEKSAQRKIAWIFISGASFLAFHQFVFRTLLSYDDSYITFGMFVFLILGLASYFPRKVWSIGNTWRVISESLMLAFSVISLLQSLLYYSFGVNDESIRAATYAVWIGFEVAALIGTIFLWRRYKYSILILIVVSAVCITLADITGMIRSWYPGIYRMTGLPDMSFSFIQYMSLMLFAYYSIDGLPEPQENEIKILPVWEWFYWNGFPRTLFTVSVATAFFVHSPDTWIVIALLLVFVIQGVVSIVEEYKLLTRITVANTELLTANTELQRRQQIEADLAAERTRTAIARDIHDSLAGHLHGASMLASVLDDYDELPLNVRQTLSLLQTTIGQAHREMRRAITTLQSERPAQPLEEVLTAPVEDARRYGLPVTMEVRGDARLLPASTADELALVVREALTNALKHAQASQVQVTVDYSDPTALAITIADNGVGMQVPAGAHLVGAGNGMGNMRTRVEALGGTLDLPEVEQGVMLWICIPRT